MADVLLRCCPAARIRLLRFAIPLRARQPAQAVSSAGVLQNQGIIKMVKAGLDDAIIIAFQMVAPRK
jgi:hypothetical protein